MSSYLVEWCSAFVPSSPHFIEAVDEQYLVFVLRIWLKCNKVARRDVFAARFLRFLLERVRLPRTWIAKQHICGLLAIFLQRAEADALVRTMINFRASSRNEER